MTDSFRRNDSRVLATITIVVVAIVAALSALWLSSASAQNRSQIVQQKVTPMPTTATGDFAVKVLPDGPVDEAEGASLGRMTLDKQFTGDLAATSKGQMLTAMTDVKGSAGYVAIERVTGTLNGRSGSFVLQHNATMSAAGPMMNIIVVPDSGTGELTGITGHMKIIITDGKHSYDFSYSLPPTGGH
jgi:hypothetical protein